MFEPCIGKKWFRECIMEKGCFFMALSSYRTEGKLETEITEQIEAFTDNVNSLVFIIIFVFYGQFCISFMPCSMFSLFWVGKFLQSLFL